MINYSFGVLVLLVVIFGVILARSIRIIPQASAGLVERLGRCHRTLGAGLTIIIPFVDRLRPLIDMRERVVSFPPQPVITEDNLVVSIDTVIYFQVTDPKSAIYEICDQLESNNYNGVIVIKSTVEPETTNKFSEKYPTLHFIHNPEFLTARTAFEDFHNQKHIVLGKTKQLDDVVYKILTDFYAPLYPGADFSYCSCDESESMKLFVNCFYSVKVQFFNEIFFKIKKKLPFLPLFPLHFLLIHK